MGRLTGSIADPVVLMDTWKRGLDWNFNGPALYVSLIATGVYHRSSVK